MKHLRSVGVIAVLAIGALSGCYRTHLVFDGGTPRDIDAPGVAKTAKFSRTFVIGLWELDAPIPIDGICPSGVAYIYQRLGGWAWVIAVISGGIVEARDVAIVCRDGSRAEVKLVARRNAAVP
jgi:hypothetical protein